MAVSVSCECGRMLNAPETMAGKRAKCPGCSRVLEIPEALEVIASEPKPSLGPEKTILLKADPAKSPGAAPGAGVWSHADIAAEVRNALEGKSIEPVSQPLSYRLSLLVVSFLMVMLPLVYLGLIVAVACGVWFHVRSNLWILGSPNQGSRGGGKAFVFQLMLYLTPIVAGATMVLFMLKPLFARSIPKPGSRSMEPSDEPLLFDFVSRTCEAVGASKPSRIDIDNEVNASASFRSGVRSFIGNDLVLTIGMPLAAGLTMRQFGGVLAHEFGHFSQGAGMRLSYLIRSVNFWFHRVVNERDAWDERLEVWSATLDFRIGWMLYVARFFVWLSRRVLWCLMMIGHFFSSILMRQMEFDADRHEARFAGSDTFAETARRLRLLGLATNAAMSDLSDFHREGRLCDNMPKLVVHNLKEIPVAVLEAIEVEIQDSKTGFFDTHPADSERIANAMAEDAPGIFRLDWPATLLFSDFDAVARKVTTDFYRQVLGEDIKESDIHPVEDLLGRQKVEQETMRALKRFFRCLPLPYRQFPSPGEAQNPVTDAGAVAGRLGEARHLALQYAGDYTGAKDKMDTADTRLLAVAVAENLLEISLPVSKGEFKQDLSSKKAAALEREKAASRMQENIARMSPFEAASAARLYSALRLAQTTDHVPDLEAGGFAVGEVARLLDLFQRFNEGIGPVLTLQRNRIIFEKLGERLESHAGSNDKLLPRFKEIMAEMRGGVCSILDSFGDRPYPFDHAVKGIALRDFLLKKLPPEDDPVAIHGAAEAVFGKFFGLHIRVLGRLCQVAEAVESRLGFPPLSDPSDEPSAAQGDDD